MSNNNLSGAVRDVLIRVLEEWAMMMTDSITTPEGHFEQASAYYSSTVAFSGGSRQGTCAIFCQKPFLAALGFSLLEPEDSDDETMQLDALGEMGNVICGNFVTEAFGADDVYHLSIPTCRVVDQLAFTEAFATEHCICLADDTAVVLAISVSNK
jgi:hypothetical protein